MVNTSSTYLETVNLVTRALEASPDFIRLPMDAQSEVVKDVAGRVIATVEGWNNPERPDEIQITLTVPFAHSMIALLSSLITYLDVQKDMHAQTRKPNDNNAATMTEYCERSRDGLTVLRDTIKAVVVETGKAVTA